MPTTGQAGQRLFYTCNIQSRPPLYRSFSKWPSQQRTPSTRSIRRLRSRDPQKPAFKLSHRPFLRRLLLHRPSSFDRKRLVLDKALIPTTIQKLNEYVEESKKTKFLHSVGLQGEPIALARERCYEFVKQTLEQFKGWDNAQNWTPPAMLEQLREATIRNGQEGLDAQLLLYLRGFIANYRFTISDIKNQARVADLRYPSEWFPATRAVQRTIHLHVGPTNSGKTYHALKRLEQAETGIYAGPLRLLAHEVYSRLNAKGKPCSLITGDEQIMTERPLGKPPMISCTVEMVPLNADVEVAVVDEIQMIGQSDRGWAWTQAVLGLKARELHLCGEERATSIVQELAAATGDKLEIHRYERLSPLRCMSESLEGNLRSLRKGDCVVVFSRLTLHALKKRIENLTGKRVAVVYGSLPPEIRAQQARLFNDPDNDYDFLVATDAIGMGLNLSIKRIVFESVFRNSGSGAKPLPIQDIKQIAGRAGRYRTAKDDEVEAESRASQDIVSSSTEARTPPFVPQNLGLVTTLEPKDLSLVERAMKRQAQPIISAGIFPPASIQQRFANYFPPETPFGYIIVRLHEICRMHPRFHLCDLRDQIGVADLIHPVKDLTIMDRIQFCAAPVSMRDSSVKKACLAYARCVAEKGGGELLQISALKLELLDVDTSQMKGGEQFKLYFEELEGLHKSLVLYLWLSYRFTGIFKSHALARHVKQLIERKIDEALSGTWVQEKGFLNARQKHMLHNLQQSISPEELPPGSKNSTSTISEDQEAPQHSVPLLDDRSIPVQVAMTA